MYVLKQPTNNKNNKPLYTHTRTHFVPPKILLTKNNKQNKSKLIYLTTIAHWHTVKCARVSSLNSKSLHFRNVLSLLSFQITTSNTLTNTHTVHDGVRWILPSHTMLGRDIWFLLSNWEYSIYAFALLLLCTEIVCVHLVDLIIAWIRQKTKGAYHTFLHTILRWHVWLQEHIDIIPMKALPK